MSFSKFDKFSYLKRHAGQILNKIKNKICPPSSRQVRRIYCLKALLNYLSACRWTQWSWQARGAEEKIGRILDPVWILGPICPDQAGTNCGKLANGLRGTNWIFEDQKVSQGVLNRSEAVLIPRSLNLGPQGRQPQKYWLVRLVWCLMLKGALFCLMKLCWRHFCRKCRKNLNIRVLRTKFWVKSACEDAPQVVQACLKQTTLIPLFRP